MPSKYNLIETLRNNDELTKIMYRGGFVELESFKKFIGENSINEEELIDAKYVIENKTPDGKRFIKATYGHKGKIADIVNYGLYSRYDGPYKVFCITHVSLEGLGAINFKRTFNILNVPERCDNKGVKGFIDVVKARDQGVEFWSQVGDRYKNKIFCFDLKLPEYIQKLEYVDDYTSPERLKRTHVNSINYYKELIKGEFTDEEKTEMAVEKVRSLIIEDDREDETNFETNFEALNI